MVRCAGNFMVLPSPAEDTGRPDVSRDGAGAAGGDDKRRGYCIAARVHYVWQ